MLQVTDVDRSGDLNFAAHGHLQYTLSGAAFYICSTWSIGVHTVLLWGCTLCVGMSCAVWCICSTYDHVLLIYPNTQSAASILSYYEAAHFVLGCHVLRAALAAHMIMCCKFIPTHKVQPLYCPIMRLHIMCWDVVCCVLYLQHIWLCAANLSQHTKYST